MPVYKTPNVYVEEISTLPPSVAPVATAVPAFVGYTETAGANTADAIVPVRINSLLDYERLFGGPDPTAFTVTVADDGSLTVAAETANGVTPKFLMYYALRLFFSNGGGSCYIVSVGTYSDAVSEEALANGLAAIYKQDEPTLLLLTDALNLSETAYYTLCQSALQQCNTLKDRFAIFDVLNSDNSITDGIGASFRNGIGTNDLKYGAAYYPYLDTAIPYQYTDESVSIVGLPDTEVAASTSPLGEYRIGVDGLLVTYTGPESDNPRVRVTTTNRTTVLVEAVDGVLIIRLPNAGASIRDILASATEVGNYTLAAIGADTVVIDSALAETPLVYTSTPASTNLAAIKTHKTELYSTIKATLNEMTVTMPPSGAIAGIYAKTDRDRGVWKAPANVSVAAVIGPTVRLTNEDQDDLNVDVNGGKSINAIRSFTGKGTLVWGARTLAGNDNEWRYISVRRLFNLIEESLQKATNFVVFESNHAVTWLKVKTLIETYLEGLWRQGALAGATQTDAYFVSVGLGQSMTSQDILEGRMIINIGVAAVRPAEFIVLRFSHKLQQS